VFWTTKFGQPSEPEPEPEPDFPNLKYPTKNPDIRPIRPKIAEHSPQDTPTQTPVPQRPQTHPRAQQWLFSIPANSLNFIGGLPAQPVARSHRNSVSVPAVGFRGPPSNFGTRSPPNSRQKVQISENFSFLRHSGLSRPPPSRPPASGTRGNPPPVVQQPDPPGRAYGRAEHRNNTTNPHRIGKRPNKNNVEQRFGQIGLLQNTTVDPTYSPHSTFHSVPPDSAWLDTDKCLCPLPYPQQAHSQ